MNMDAVLVMLLVIVSVPGMGQVLPGMVIGDGMSVGMFDVRNMRTFNDSEQQGVIEQQHQGYEEFAGVPGHGWAPKRSKNG